MDLVKHVQSCIEKAERKETKLVESIFQIQGMSGRKVQIFLNELCALEGMRYLEIGCHLGKTLISAMYQNGMSTCMAIDNFSQPFACNGDVKTCLVANLHKYEGGCVLLERDYTDPNTPLLATGHRFTILFVDGYHTEEHTHHILTKYQQCMADQYVLIVDDWKWVAVREGYESAKKVMGWDSLYTWEHRDRNVAPDHGGWWNGIFIEVVSK